MTKTATAITTFGTAKAFTQDACSGTLLTVLNRALGHPMKAEESASNVLAGGIMTHGYQCGQLWGASLAAGAEAHRRYRPGPRAEAAAMNAARRLVDAFRELNGATDCFDLTDADFQKKTGLLKYFVKAGPIACGRMAVRFAPVALDVINEALAEEPEEHTSGCGSCAAMIAREMGASELQATMAAGLAGGIGFSGGGCGALGVALWITSLSNPDEEIGLSAEGTKFGEVIDAFLQASDHQFECSEIAGREFDDMDDHAQYLRSGGCSELINALVAASAANDTSTEDVRVA